MLSMPGDVIKDFVILLFGDRIGWVFAAVLIFLYIGHFLLCQAIRINVLPLIFLFIFSSVSSLNKSSSIKLSNPRSSTILNNLCADTGLIDVWRQLNPKVRDYTFYSLPHKSYSRLDYFFIPKQFLQAVQACHIDSIVISDHAPVVLFINLAFSIPRTPIWKLNTFLLHSESLRSFVRKKCIPLLD